MCGGSLLSPLTLLTSAHCVRHLANHSLVLLGQTDLGGGEGGEEGGEEGGRAQLRRVRASILHPGWTGTPRNDLALLLLDSPVRLTDSVRPICLPESPQPPRPPQYGVISGWGRTSSGGPASSHLQSGQVEILSQEECRHLLPHLPHQQTEGDLLCARGLPTGRSELTTDACQVSHAGEPGGSNITERNRRETVGAPSPRKTTSLVCGDLPGWWQQGGGVGTVGTRGFMSVSAITWTGSNKTFSKSFKQ